MSHRPPPAREPDPAGPDSAPPPTAGRPAQPQRAATAGGESRYPARPAAGPAGRDPERNRVLRLTLTEPETAPMSEQQHEQAVTVLATMIASWVQRRIYRHHDAPPTP